MRAAELASLAPWAERAEATYVARALARAAPSPLPLPGSWSAAARAVAPAAVACAVAARYLAVGTPRSLAVLSEDPERAHLLALAHQVWHRPTELRWAVTSGAEELVRVRGGREVPIAEALTADVVCVDLPLPLGLAQVRRGSHLALVRGSAEPALLERATCAGERAGGAVSVTIGELAAGLRDGRQLDELTLLLLADELAIARSALDG